MTSIRTRPAARPRRLYTLTGAGQANAEQTMRDHAHRILGAAALGKLAPRLSALGVLEWGLRAARRNPEARLMAGLDRIVVAADRHAVRPDEAALQLHDTVDCSVPLLQADDSLVPHNL